MTDKTQIYTILHADLPDKDGGFKVFNNEAAANKGWDDIVSTAVKASVQKNRTFVLREFKVELEEGLDTRAIDAKGLVENGSAAQSRWSSIRSPIDLLVKTKTVGPNVVTEAVIKKAQKVIDDKATEFPGWAREDIILIEEDLQRLMIEINNQSENITITRDDLYQRYYQLRGQGGTFGFMMVTTGCAMSCQLLDGLKTIRASDISSLSVILDGIKLILRQPELKDNEAVCKALTDGFSDVVAKALCK